MDRRHIACLLAGILCRDVDMGCAMFHCATLDHFPYRPFLYHRRGIKELEDCNMGKIIGLAILAGIGHVLFLGGRGLFRTWRIPVIIGVCLCRCGKCGHEKRSRWTRTERLDT